MSYGSVHASDTRSSTGRSILRVGALLSAGLVLASFLTAIYHVVDVIGEPSELVTVTAVTLIAATICARVLSVRRAALVAVLLLTGGIAWYLAELPTENTFAVAAHAEYLVALLAGHSILEIVNLREWVLAVTPTPVFLTWYLALRRRYGASALVGGSTVGFFVLTGDATFPVAMLGTVGVVALLGLGTLERADASLVDAEVLGTVLAAVIVVSLTVSMVPQGAAMTYTPETGFHSSAGFTTGDTLEADLLSAGDRLQVGGSTNLSPKVRWTVESEQERYWRVGAYDLYTGDGWARQATTSADRTPLGQPSGPSKRVLQQYTAESQIATMPAAWRPTEVSGTNALVTDYGGLQPNSPLEAGDSYTVISHVPEPSPRDLQQAGTAYPEYVRQRFLQLPDSTPDRVGETTSRLTENAETPYETALTIEKWLKTNKGYSLDVSRPSGSIADGFLFEMERGYCTYFATTMAVMLRSQGIPARMVVGYTPGEPVDSETWVVRGYNSHAWVEVYFPDVGWVRFDPTPAAPRLGSERVALENARRGNQSNVDTDDTRGSDTTQPGSDPPGWIPDNPQQPNGTNGTNGTVTATPSTADGVALAEDSSGGLPELPSREHLLLGAIAGIGAIAGVRRSGASGRLYRELWLRWQPRSDPEADVQRAYDRVEYQLERTERPRRVHESPRTYVEAIDADERARELVTLYERARYSEDVDAAAADRAVELADAVVADL